MKDSSFAVRTAWVLAAVVTFAPVMVAQKVSVDYDHKTDFARYHTFSVYRVKASNSLVEGRLRDDIAEALQQKGWQQVPQGGDVAVTAIGSIHNQQQFTSFYNGLGGGYGWGGWRGGWGFGGWGGPGFGGGTTTTVQNIPIGQLVVDLYDTGTHQLVFRGYATDTLSSKPEKNARKSEKAVDKIFDKLPNKVG